MAAIVHQLTRFAGRIRDRLRSCVRRKAVCDPTLLHIMGRYLASGDVVFDVGAFDGSFSRAFSEAGYVVHAFEGAPVNAEEFRKTCGGMTGITLHEVALHEETVTARTRFNDCRGTEHPEIEVHYVELDRYCDEQRLPVPDYVKMDIEGMESVALKKMTHMIRAVRPIFQIEIHNSPTFAKFKYAHYPSFVDRAEGGFDFDEFLRQGYLMYAVETDGRLTPAKALRGSRTQYLFVPSERETRGRAGPAVNAHGRSGRGARDR